MFVLYSIQHLMNNKADRWYASPRTSPPHLLLAGDSAHQLPPGQHLDRRCQYVGPGQLCGTGAPPSGVPKVYRMPVAGGKRVLPPGREVADAGQTAAGALGDTQPLVGRRRL